MTGSKLRFTTLTIGAFLLAGLIPATQAGGAPTGAVGSSSATGDGVVNYQVALHSQDGFQKKCFKKNGRRICRTHADFFAGFHSQHDEGESPDQDECRFDRKVILFEKTRSGRDKIDSGTTDAGGFYDFGNVKGVSRGDEFVATSPSTTFADRYGDLITCAATTSRVLTL